MKILTLFLSTAALVIGAPVYTGATYADYRGWKDSSMQTGAFTKQELAVLALAEAEIHSFATNVLAFQDDPTAKAVFITLIRNKSLAEIEDIVAIVRLAKAEKFRSEFELVAVQNERLLHEAASPERKEKLTKLAEVSAESLKEEELKAATAKTELLKRIK